MKFTILLHLLHFMQTTSFPNNLTTEPSFEVQVFSNKLEHMDKNHKLNDFETDEELILVHIIGNHKVTYNAGDKLHHDKGYVFTYIQGSRYDIMYWVGDKLTKVGRAYVFAGAAKTLTEAFENFPLLDIYITRKPSDSTFQKFGDVVSVNVTKKIPRLYDVAGADIINQVKIISLALKTMNSYVLYDECAVTVYHTQPKNDTKTMDDIKKKTAEAFAKYIVKFENIENNSISSLNDTEEYFNADKVSFINKILKTLYNNSQSKPSNAENSEFNKEVTLFGYYGSKECQLKNESPRIDSLKSTCIYIVDDCHNGEFSIYIGNKTTYVTQTKALGSAENAYRILNKKLTLLVEGNPLPPAFIIHVRSEIKNFLKDSS